MKKNPLFLAFTLAAFLLCHSTLKATTPCCTEPSGQGQYFLNDCSCSCYSYPHYLDLALSHIEGGGIGYDVGYTTASAFYVPLLTCQWGYPFLDSRVHLFDNGKFASTLGVGFRSYCSSLARLFGLNFYFDCQDTDLGHFNQIGAGFELLGPCLDLRLNGYYPVGTRAKLAEHCEFSYPGGYFATEDVYLNALKGLDGEVGGYLCRGNCVSWYGAVGVYMLNCDFSKYFVGGRARLSTVFNNNVYLDLYLTHDALFDTKFQVEVTLPFIFPCCMRDWDCLFPRIWRNEIIPLVNPIRIHTRFN